MSDPVTLKHLAELIERHSQAMAAQFAAVNERLTVLEQQLATLPHLEFLRTNEMAKEVVVALRKHVTPLRPHDPMPVPQDDPGRDRADRRRY